MNARTNLKAPYKVYVVVDREFGERLAELEQGMPVWIVDTPANKTVAQRLWKDQPQEGHLAGVTTFKDFESSSPEDIFLAQLDAIDLHHGSHSADPPYSVLEVFGAPLTARVKAELSAYGFSTFHPTSEGFTAVRSKPTA